MLIRVVLALIFALAAGFYFKNAFVQIHAHAGHKHWISFADGISILSVGLYTFLIACIYAVRLRPLNRSTKLIPTATAIGGGFLTCGLLFLPLRTSLPVGLTLAGIALVLIGNIFAIASLGYLGRSFSILPEGRRLVMAGPYRFIRHPLYMAEAVATIGAMISFLSPAAVGIVAAQFLLQLGRIHYEEKILRETFPRYADYSRDTARLIPGVY